MTSQINRAVLFVLLVCAAALVYVVIQKHKRSEALAQQRAEEATARINAEKLAEEEKASKEEQIFERIQHADHYILSLVRVRTSIGGKLSRFLVQSPRMQDVESALGKPDVTKKNSDGVVWYYGTDTKSETVKLQNEPYRLDVFAEFDFINGTVSLIRHRGGKGCEELTRLSNFTQTEDCW